MSTDTMPARTEDRTGCTATRHDTARAYADFGCRCPDARTANSQRVARNRKARILNRRAQNQPDVVLRTVRVQPTPGMFFAVDPVRACAPGKIADPDVFAGDTADQRRTAKGICDTCPVQEACLDWSMRPGHEQEHGVWGGVDALERRAGVKQREQEQAEQT
jgi:WhiB family redox-sensing transcriptional regulator